MSLKPENAVQLYHEVRKASGEELPTQSAFYSFASKIRDNELTSALNSMSEEDFSSPHKFILKIGKIYYNKDKSNSKSWVQKISENKKSPIITQTK